MQTLGRATGAFHWNRAGWFGGQIGATLWLVLTGVLLLAVGRSEGAVVVALGLLPNALGCVLWLRRRALNPFPALQLLIGVAGLSALAALLYLRQAGVAGESSAPADLRVLLVYPAVMTMFFVQERAARRQPS